VHILKFAKLESIEQEEIIVTKDGNSEILRGFSTPVFAVASCPENALAESTHGAVTVVYVIDNAVVLRNALHAIREGNKEGEKYR
jgi:hypothetical protein